VLSQAGLLVTKDAPKDMPDRGRTKILWACPSGKSDIVHLEMPREDLVPFGGAAPIDVFAVRVEDAAILVAVMASWNDKSNVLLALAGGASSLQDMIRSAKRVRAQKVAAKGAEASSQAVLVAPPAEPGRKGRERSSAVPAEPARRERTSGAPAEPHRRERTSAVPAETGRRHRTSVAPPAEPHRRERTSVAPPAEPHRRERTSAVPAEAKRDRAPSDPGRRDRAPSDPGRRDRASVAPRASKEAPSKKLTRPEGGANLARLEALAARVQAAAKRREARARISSEPEITMGEAPVGRETLVAIEAELPALAAGPSPESVRVELASIGRETMLEIARFEASEHVRAPTVDDPLVVQDRRTLPWVDPATLKRAADAKAAIRGISPPDVKVTVEEIDPDALERELGGTGRR